MNSSEKLASDVLSRLLPKGRKLIAVQQQSSGEHDFDIYDERGRRVGIVEVTAAIHQCSRQSIAWKNKHGEIYCSELKSGWLLMAHNPDPKWLTTTGAKSLVIFEENDVSEFDHQTRYTQRGDVARAAQQLWDNGIENGQSVSGAPGSIGLLISRGENSDSWTISAENVINVIANEIDKKDNRRKLSLESSFEIERHFFVEVDLITRPAAADSLIHADLPESRTDFYPATHIWAATRTSDKTTVWHCGAEGWKLWDIEQEESEGSSLST